MTEWLSGWHLCFVFRRTGFEIRSRGPTCLAEICKGGRCVRLTNLPPSCADCIEFWEPQPPGTLRACPGLHRDFFSFTYRKVVNNNNNVFSLFILSLTSTIPVHPANNNNVFSLFILSLTSTIPVHPAKSKLKIKKEQRPLLRGWKHLLSVVALKVLTSSTNLFVQFLNLGYCDSASRVLTPLNPLLRNDTLTCRHPMKPEILPIKSEQRKKFVFILMFPFSVIIFAILLCLKVKCQISQFLLIPGLLGSDSANRD